MSAICFCITEIKDPVQIKRYQDKIINIANIYGRGVSFSIDWEEPLLERYADAYIIADFHDSPTESNCEMLIMPDHWQYNNKRNELSFRQRMALFQDVAAWATVQGYSMEFFIGNSGTNWNEFETIIVPAKHLTNVLIETVGESGSDADIHIVVKP